MKKLIIAPALLGVALITGCAGTSSTSNTSGDEPITVGDTAELRQQLDQERARTKQLDAQVAAAEAKADTPSSTPEPDIDRVDEAERKVQDNGRDKRIVPDVVGRDHQLAQDTMQAAGFYLLDEIDCTGQGRLLLLDRNWTVESQKPAAGKRVSTEATITLCSVKDDER